MDKITLGQVAASLAFIVALITAIVKIKDTVKKWLEGLLKDKFDALEKMNREKFAGLEASIADLRAQNSTIDLENCKNYLVTYISEIKRGETKDEIEKERFWEEYAHYIKNGGNSYIKENVETLRKNGKL